ncbi:MAG: ECF transporter S component [Candidatus Thorarchaeota archaeon]|nr:MAG: ECF transporter S component [Candidatus Thorarchaeota archaeon]
MEPFKTKNSNRSMFIAMVAIFTSLSTIATVVFVVPFPSTQGYFNLGDTFVMLSGLLLGPIGGFIAGGTGSALGDALLGFPAFMPITFFAKGFEGFFVGLFSSRTRLRERASWWDVIGVLFGSAAMLTGYFLGEVFVLGVPFGVALIELVTINSVQVIMGSIFTIAIGPLLREYLRNYTYSEEEHQDWMIVTEKSPETAGV